MKKSKITLGLVSSLLSVAALGACNGPTYSPDGNILTYTNSAGQKIEYSADELFSTYMKDSSSISTVFESVYKLIIRNFFLVEEAGKKEYSEIKKGAQNDVEGKKDEANKSADANGTSYDVEFDSILKNYNCDDEDELLEHFIYEREKDKFDELFYDNNIELLRDGDDTYTGYLESKLPYHVRHFLIKMSDTEDKGVWNASIGKQYSLDLADVARRLANGEAFGTITEELSEDSSASSFGDLGIMDKDTSYVNEFKLGIYAYENLFRKETAVKAAESSIAMSEKQKEDFLDAIDMSSYGGDEAGNIPTIPYGAFVKMGEYAEIETVGNNRKVHDGDSRYFPRNIVYNKYFNRHSFALVTPNDVAGGEIIEGEVEGENMTGTLNEDYAALAGFQEFEFANGQTLKVLTSSTGNPILVTKGSGYDGIHFITVERSALVETQNGVTLSQYYTTKYPGQADFPKDESGKDLRTYVNFLDDQGKNYKSRAENLENKIKTFDSNLNKYIFNKYLESEKIKFSNEEISKAVQEWIERAIEKTDYDAKKSWDNTWESYINSLEQIKVEKQNLISEACAIGFANNNTDTDDWNALGGVCNDNKAR